MFYEGTNDVVVVFLSVRDFIGGSGNYTAMWLRMVIIVFDAFANA